MCGIIGGNLPDKCPPEIFSRMVNGLQHRGPDARGEFRDEHVMLGHRRLSILDLSERGAQPMANDDGSIIIVYNGECYNHRELRELLPNVLWKSECDTETLLRLYEQFGKEFIQHVVGMFSLAIYDIKKGKLLLFRDRLGEKPLYYYFKNDLFLFSSEIKPLLLHQGIEKKIHQEGLREYFLYNYVPAPKSIFEEIRKLPAAHSLEFSVARPEVRISRYWNPEDFAQENKRQQRLEEAADELEELLFRAVKGQALSDVPLGCFLSGGIDSSLVAMALQRNMGRTRTFNIGFGEEEYDESTHARRVAEHLDTEHHEERLTAASCMDIIPGLAGVTGEPFADASILPTMLLAQFTKRHVTVALSGDGGDELFLGYDRYRWAEQVRERMRLVPAALRRGAASLAARLPSYRLQMIANGMSFTADSGIYPSVFVGWNAPFVSRLFGEPLRMEEQWMSSCARRMRGMTTREVAAFIDMQHYLPDDILVKVDRAAMAHSLETRVPLLDHRIVEFALRLSVEHKMIGSAQKIILKKVLFRHVPKEIFERPKAGFAVPLKKWFRGPLKKDLEEALAPDELRRHGLFNVEYVQLLLKRHASGNWNYERQLFALLVFQHWHREMFP